MVQRYKTICYLERNFMLILAKDNRLHNVTCTNIAL